MEKKFVSEPLSFGATIELEVTRVGKDLHLLLSGGSAPHIGTVVISEPRPSLTGDGSVSATSSVMNRVGHKDEEICRLLAERVCKTENCPVVCAGGFHVDHLSEAQIEEVRCVVAERLVPKIIKK